MFACFKRATMLSSVSLEGRAAAKHAVTSMPVVTLEWRAQRRVPLQPRTSSSSYSHTPRPEGKGEEEEESNREEEESHKVFSL